jgi:acyl carrier protein
VTAAGTGIPARGTVGTEVRQLLRSHLPLRWRDRELPDRLALGSDGLGLDSIRLLEVVLACEEHFQVSISAEDLRVAGPTLGDLVTLIELALARVVPA